MKVVDLLVSIRGRIGRATYWLTLLPLVLTGILGWLLSGADDVQTAIFGNVLGLTVVWPLVAVNVKRWHDRDKPGWWMFVGVIPLLGQVWTIIECGLLRGSPGYNAYGEPPPKILLPAQAKSGSGPSDRNRAAMALADNAEARLSPELASLMKMVGLMLRTEPKAQREKLDLLHNFLTENLGLEDDQIADAITVARGARFSRDAFETHAEIVKAGHVVIEEAIEESLEDSPETEDESEIHQGAGFTMHNSTPPGMENEARTQVDSVALNTISDLLFHLAMADDRLSEKEEVLLSQLYGVFGFRGSAFSSHRYMYGSWESGTAPQVPIGERPHYYAKVLGISGEITPEAVRKAYRRLVKEYHPDKVITLGPKLREAADVEMKKINEAYAFFSRKLGL